MFTDKFLLISSIQYRSVVLSSPRALSKVFIVLCMSNCYIFCSSLGLLCIALYVLLSTEPLYCASDHGHEEITYIPLHTSDFFLS